MGVFSPETGGVTLSINAGNTAQALPAGQGNVLRVVNTGIAGAVAVHCRLAASAAAAVATTSDPPVVPSGLANELLLDIAVGVHTHIGLIGAAAGPSTVLITRGFYRG